MKKPLTNDFGVFISRDKARVALMMAGWFICPYKRNWHKGWDLSEPFVTLRRAWELHTGVPQ